MKLEGPAKTPGLPFVAVNMAMTADGKIATANRAISSFGSKRDHDHLLELRATMDAVICGARTADLNDINLGPGPLRFRRARLQRGLAEYNLRVILSGSGSINPRAKVFQHHFSPVIVLTTQRASAAALKRLKAVRAEVAVFGEDVLDLCAALLWLRKAKGVRRLMCEGGGEVNDAMFRAGLVDELHLTVCPQIFGGRAAPTIAEGIGFPKLAGAMQLRLISCTRIGEECFLRYACNKGGCAEISLPQAEPPQAAGKQCEYDQA